MAPTSLLWQRQWQRSPPRLRRRRRGPPWGARPAQPQVPPEPPLFFLGKFHVKKRHSVARGSSGGWLHARAGGARQQRVSRRSHDTISMLALDGAGNAAAGSSTNGASHKVYIYLSILTNIHYSKCNTYSLKCSLSNLPSFYIICM